MRPGVRVGLLGLAGGIGWLILSLFGGGSSATADTGEDQDGLLGSVVLPATATTVVGTASDLVADVPLGAVTAPVAVVVEGLVGDTVAELPGVGQVVDELLGTTTAGDLVDTVVGDVDHVVGGGRGHRSGRRRRTPGTPGTPGDPAAPGTSGGSTGAGDSASKGAAVDCSTRCDRGRGPGHRWGGTAPDSRSAPVRRIPPAGVIEEAEG